MGNNWRKGEATHLVLQKRGFGNGSKYTSLTFNKEEGRPFCRPRGVRESRILR